MREVSNRIIKGMLNSLGILCPMLAMKMGRLRLYSRLLGRVRNRLVIGPREVGRSY